MERNAYFQVLLQILDPPASTSSRGHAGRNRIRLYLEPTTLTENKVGLLARIL